MPADCSNSRAPNAIAISYGSLTCPSKHRHGATLFTVIRNKSPKGHWSLTWVQWALLLKVKFLSKSESMTAIFVKSVRTATIAIFQFRIRGCIQFVAVAFWSEEEVLWRRNPSLTYFWQIAPPPWIRPWVEFTEKPINRCVIMSTSSLSSFVNIHQVVL